jgi:hypothetical protein
MKSQPDSVPSSYFGANMLALDYDAMLLPGGMDRASFARKVCDRWLNSFEGAVALWAGA